MAVLSILAVIYTAKNNIVMNTLNGGIPIASFIYNSPNREQFKSYIKTLRACIESVQEQNSHKTTDRLANELAEHRRLKSGMIITDKDYEQAKNRILSQH